MLERSTYTTVEVPYEYEQLPLPLMLGPLVERSEGSSITFRIQNRYIASLFKLFLSRRLI